jgi:hypothetical protein
MFQIFFQWNRTRNAFKCFEKKIGNVSHKNYKCFKIFNEMKL